MQPHLAFIGCEAQSLRIPFLPAIQRRGYRVTAASPGPGDAFTHTGIAHAKFWFDRFPSCVSEVKALWRLRSAVAGLGADLVQALPRSRTSSCRSSSGVPFR